MQMTTNSKNSGAPSSLNNPDDDFPPDHPCAKACNELLSAIQSLQAEITRARGSESASRLFRFMETIGLDKTLITYKLDDDDRALAAAQHIKSAMIHLRELADANPAFFDKNSPAGFTFPGEAIPRVIYLRHSNHTFYLPKQSDIAKIIPGNHRRLHINIDSDLSGIFLYATGRHPILNSPNEMSPDPSDDADDRPRKNRRR
jgi:hypothetical protein